MLSSLLSAFSRFFKGSANSWTSDNAIGTEETCDESYKDEEIFEKGNSESSSASANGIVKSLPVADEYDVADNVNCSEECWSSRNFENDGCTKTAENIDHREYCTESLENTYDYNYRRNRADSGVCLWTHMVDETKDFSQGDKEYYRHLYQNALNSGQSNEIHVRCAEKLKKCECLPNSFRTTSIQDKSLKLSRKRRKYASHWKRGKLNPTSKMENEGNKPRGETRSDDEEVVSKLVVQSLETETTDFVHSKTKLNSIIWKTFDELFDKCSSDSEEYYSCNEEMPEVKTDSRDINNHERKKSKTLQRISSIEKRSWSIRQRRRENFYKRRSMDISVTNHV